MDAHNKYEGTAPPQKFEDFDPIYNLVHKPQVDTLILYLPDFTKQQLRVQLTGAGVLKISGQTPIGDDKWKRFLKQFPVSFNCDTNRIKVKFETGFLSITLPKLLLPAEKPVAGVFPLEPAKSTSDTEAAAQLKMSRKIMNVVLVILVVVGGGLFLNNKIRSRSANNDGDL